MANNVINQSSEGSLIASMPRSAKVWVAGLLGSATFLVALGVWMAAVTQGVPVPWAPPALAVVLALAAITGVSKTSSA